MEDYRACRCGFAGTNITPDGLCATCGEPLNRESVAWLAKDYGRLHTEHRGAVDLLREIREPIEDVYQDSSNWKDVRKRIDTFLASHGGR